MNIEIEGTKVTLGLTVDQALQLAENLLASARHASRFKVASNAFGAVVTIGEKNFPSLLNVSIERE